MALKQNKYSSEVQNTGSEHAKGHKKMFLGLAWHSTGEHTLVTINANRI